MKRILLSLLLASVPFLPVWAQKGKAPKRDVAVVEQELSQARDSLKIAQEKYSALADRMEELDTLRRWAAGKMLWDFGDYPSRPFAQVGEGVMDSLRYMGARIATPETDRLLEEFETLENHLCVYREGISILENDYNPAAIDTAVVHIDAILPDCPADQQAELQDLQYRMQLFPVAIERAKIVAEWMADTLKDIRADADTSVNAVDLAQAIFRDQDREYQEYISKVPYMDRLYTAYMQAILQAPLTVSPEERQLLSYDF